MKQKLAIAAVCCGIAAAVYAVTNITVTVPIQENKHTNLLMVASNQSMTVEEFLSQRVVREVEDQWMSTLLDLWSKATPAQQQAALDALKPPPPPPPQEP